MNRKNSRKVSFDCQYFLGDRPCVWHKLKKVECNCEHYFPVSANLLIIKLDAMGDVLRTTCLLPCIVKAWPGIRIIWITREESVPLLENNPYISEIVTYNADALVHLTTRTFDYVISLDAGKITAGMAAMAKSRKKIGFVLREEGYVFATNEAADGWLRMGIFDDLKCANKRSYQEIMCSILGIDLEGMKYVLELTEAENDEGRIHLQRLGINLNKRIIGIHTGGGGRWPLKQWKEEQFTELIHELKRELDRNAQILLLGGPSERELNRRITRSVAESVYDTGCDNKVRHFASLINTCNVVLSGDSLAMHVALAMGRRVVVLFGPTSNTEIELFGLGEKVIPDLDCLACYKKACDFAPNCMDSISVDMVKQAILRQLALVNDSIK